MSAQAIDGEDTAADARAGWDDLVAFNEALLRSLRRRGGFATMDAEDAAHTALLHVLQRFGEMSAHCDNPSLRGMAVVRHLAEDHRRRTRAQRGEGARLALGSDGNPIVRRIIVSFDPIVHDLPSGVDLEARVVLHDTLRRVMGRLAEPDRLLLWFVYAEGRTVVSAAACLGLSRDQVNRRLASAMAACRAALSELGGVEVLGQ